MNLLAGEIEAFGGIHYKIGAATFFRVGRLLGEQDLEFLLGHAGAPEGAVALHVGWRRHHHDRVDAAV